jgi:hypothetical protein
MPCLRTPGLTVRDQESVPKREAPRRFISRFTSLPRLPMARFNVGDFVDIDFGTAVVRCGRIAKVIKAGDLPEEQGLLSDDAGDALAAADHPAYLVEVAMPTRMIDAGGNSPAAIGREPQMFMLEADLTKAEHDCSGAFMSDPSRLMGPIRR